jgi:hypothetical protein
VVYLPWCLLMRRLGVCSTFDPLLRLFSVWAIPGDMPLLFSVEEIVLLTLPLFFCLCSNFCLGHFSLLGWTLGLHYVLLPAQVPALAGYC